MPEEYTPPEQTIATLQAELEACHADTRRTAHDLGERIKELTCLYQVSALLQRSAPLPELMAHVPELLVPAYQYPEITSARVRIDGQVFASAGLRETPWRQAAPLRRRDRVYGSVEVFYGEERPDAGEGPFLIEERHLIDALAEMLARYLHRTEIEAALRAGEHKYRTLVDNLYEGIWQIDGDYNTTFVNRRTAELLGYEVDEMVGRSVFDFVDPKFHALGHEYLARGRAGQRDIHEFEFLHKDGRPIQTRVATTPLFDADGNYVGALAGIVDISARKRAEALLAESEERFRRQAAELETIYWSVPVGLAVLDRELRFLRVNRRLAEMNGLPAEMHVGKSMFEITPGFAPQAQSVMRRVLQEGEPALDMELTARSPAEAGTDRCWNTQWLPLKDAAGQVWGVNVVVEEITERKQWEENLHRREQEFEALAERAPDIIARIDRHWRFLYINRAVERVTGMPPQWFIGKTIDDLPLPETTRSLRRRAVESVFELRLEQSIEHTVDSEQGTRYFHSRLVPEFDRRGEVASVLVVDRDITDLKRVQHALEELSLHDPLTGMANRRYLEQFIAREWRRGARHRYPIALVMVDIDHFKAYNDHYGHPRGDDCLCQVAHAIQTRLHRPTDLLVRYGGEEFLLVLPETGPAEAERIAESMRTAVAELALPHPESPVAPVVTASFGVVAAPADSCDFTAMLAQADHALYRAKQAGRNRVEREATTLTC